MSLERQKLEPIYARRDVYEQGVDGFGRLYPKEERLRSVYIIGLNVFFGRRGFREFIRAEDVVTGDTYFQMGFFDRLNINMLHEIFPQLKKEDDIAELEVYQNNLHQMEKLSVKSPEIEKEYISYTKGALTAIEVWEKYINKIKNGSIGFPVDIPDEGVVVDTRRKYDTVLAGMAEEKAAALKFLKTFEPPSWTDNDKAHFDFAKYLIEKGKIRS